MKDFLFHFVAGGLLGALQTGLGAYIGYRIGLRHGPPAFIVEASNGSIAAGGDLIGCDDPANCGCDGMSGGSK